MDRNLKAVGLFRLYPVHSCYTPSPGTGQGRIHCIYGPKDLLLIQLMFLQTNSQNSLTQRGLTNVNCYPTPTPQNFLVLTFSPDSVFVPLVFFRVLR